MCAVSKENIYLGKCGETLAIDFLREKGYKILLKNYKTKLGEVDIIAQDKDTICFIEVKTRISNRYGSPQEAISKIKQRQITKASLLYLKKNNRLDKKARFDVVSILYSENKPRLDLIKNAFESGEGYVI